MLRALNASAMAIGWFAILSGGLTTVSCLLKYALSTVFGWIRRPRLLDEDYRRRYAAWLFELETQRIAASLRSRRRGAPLR
jgi:hypothetical protein